MIFTLNLILFALQSTQNELTKKWEEDNSAIIEFQFLDQSSARQGCRRINLFLVDLHYIVNFIPKANIMSKLVLSVIVLLGLATMGYSSQAYPSDTCNNCVPAFQIATCPDLHCYRCQINEILDTTTRLCACLDGFYRVNGVCSKCPDGYSYDPLTQWCTGTNPCGANQYLNNGICICLPGLIVIQNICQRCPANQTYFTQYDACRCSAGFSLVNGSCINIPCGTNQVYSGDSQSCICIFGYYLVNGTCGRCPITLNYDSTSQSCVPITRPTCGLNQYWYECCCFCQVGYVRVRGICNRCPTHSSYDWRLDACVCDPGYYFVGEDVLLLPAQSQDTTSSLTNNPNYLYGYFGPYTTGTVGVYTTGSSYDASGSSSAGAGTGAGGY